MDIQFAPVNILIAELARRVKSPDQRQEILEAALASVGYGNTTEDRAAALEVVVEANSEFFDNYTEEMTAPDQAVALHLASLFAGSMV